LSYTGSCSRAELITEGGTATIFPEYNFTNGITVESSSSLFARGSIMRGKIADKRSPIVYGYEGDQMPVYFNQDPVLTVATGTGGGGFGGGGPSIPGVGQNITPMATRPTLSPWEGPISRSGRDSTRAGARQSGDEPPAFGQNQGPQPDPMTRPRVVLQFPANQADMLLSGTLAGGQLLQNKAQVIDAPVGKGHVVMFAIRPFWRWQTQGTFMLGFNAIMNWNDLDAGRTAPSPATASRADGQ
jgi:hypothetical protein